MQTPYTFDASQFNRLFPFYILINRELRVVSSGVSVTKLYQIKEQDLFPHFFSIPRPYTPIHSFNNLEALQNQMVVIESSITQKPKLRGQFEYLPQSGELLFVGSPWFGSVEQVLENNLVIDDFAYHDPMIDLLHVLKTLEITNADLKELIGTINKQKSELKKAAKEVHDIALFPMQNPDPLIRINLTGDVIKNNPAAAPLDFFEFENNVLRNDEFFKLVAERINTAEPKWLIEASSNNRFYSFVCVPMMQEGYINVYGRDVTENKKTESEIARLSLVASANENAVLFTSPDGYITWANEAFCILTGYSMEEVIGKTPVELCKGPLTDETTLAHLLESFFNGHGFSTDIIYYRKNKTWFWGHSVSQPLKNDKGIITEFFGIIQDVTTKKANEEKLKVLSQIAEDNINGVIIADAAGNITWVNKSFTKITGYSLEEVAGKKPGQFLQGPETDKDTVAYLGKQIAKGEPFNAEILNYNKEGKKYWLRIQGQPIKNENGSIAGFFALEEDITREKESERRFKNVLESIGDNVWEHDFKTGITYFSKSDNSFLGYSSDDLTNNRQLWWNSVFKADLQLLAESNRKYQNGEADSHNLEYRLVDKHGTIRWVLDRGVVIEKNATGNPLRIIGTHTDITEMKEAEQKLDEQRKFYESILNNMPADIAVFNSNHEYLFVNPRGIKDEELRKWIVGKRDEDYCALRNRPVNIAHERRATFNKVLESKQTSEWEERYVLSNGNEQYVLRRLFPVLNNAGKVYLVIGYGIDITERKKFEVALKANEEKYRGIIANMNLGLMEMDKNGKIIFANQTLLKMTGINEVEANGYNSKRFLDTSSVNLVEERLKQRAEGISEAYEVQTNINGQRGWWFVSSAPKYSPAGKHVGSIVICLDITNQKKLEQELIKSREQAEQLAKAKEIFLANMSHEIRTPMNAILGMGNQLAKTNLTEQQNFYLNTIATAAENLLVIINDILDFSKIEAGKLNVEKIGFEPKMIAGNAMHVLMHKAEEKGIKLINSFCDTRLSPVLLGDPYRLNQVMLNLISNAIKFTEKGFVDIIFEVIDETSTHQTVKGCVIDTGIGMDNDFVEKIFDKFSQEYESVSRKFGGTGLGMSICKELVQLMGGTIEVESSKGNGTVVSFTIEFEKGDTANLPQSNSESFTGDFISNKTILVTDDNEMNRLVASTILENYGATILEAANGEEALSMLDKNIVDLVLMDIQMPVLNGYEAIRLIRKQANNIPVIALTANAIKGEADKCLEAGMNDYIAKPFKEEEFLKKIAYWLRKEIKISEQKSAPSSSTEEMMYDLGVLNSISKGNHDFVNKMLNLFCEQAPVMVKQMKEAYDQKNLEAMGAIAHKMKPSIDNLKIESLKQVIRKIEKHGKEMNDAADLNELLDTIASTIQLVIVQIQSVKN
jgi:PAS domain S-box-containing protein